LITASPANDTITPLMALDAGVKIISVRGERTVPLRSFYKGVRKTVMQPDEMLVDIFFPALQAGKQGVFLKLGLRQAQAISLVNIAIRLGMDGGKVSEAAVTLGAVAPTIIHARKAEIYLLGKELTDETIAEAARLSMEAATPIDDVRGSAAYRRAMVRVLSSRGLRSFLGEETYAQFPENPVLLWGQSYTGEAPLLETSSEHLEGSEISTNVNGIEYRTVVGYDQTLLDFLRDELGLIGTKEGCAEGECGACTIWLDGMAVMACLVPAARAHGAEIVTVEGLGDAENLHPVQQAFIHEGAVQCGYCTPGFLMSAAKLLEEIPAPSKDQIKEAITGNLCRCTGYYKIVEAIEQAGQKSVAGFRN
jgi:carbon-monoxide dehydrogenase medium subunit